MRFAVLFLLHVRHDRPKPGDKQDVHSVLPRFYVGIAASAALANFLQQIIERPVLEQLSALFGVVTGPRGELPDEPSGIRDAKFPSQELDGFFIELVQRLDLDVHDSILSMSSIGVSTDVLLVSTSRLRRIT